MLLESSVSPSVDPATRESKRLSPGHSLLLAALVALGAVAVPAAPTGDTATIRRIAFGSCLRHHKEQAMWWPILRARPDLFLFLGDNIYGDTEDMEVLRRKYTMLGGKRGYRLMREQTKILAIWDDHDYGKNDGGAEYPMKAESQRIFLDFFQEPADSPRRGHPGIYDVRTFGPPGRRVQVILLDTRYFRRLPSGRRAGDGLGPDPRHGNDPGEMLGETQWAWLAGTLREPAELRLVLTSTSVIADEHMTEKWGDIPAERLKLFSVLRESGAKGLVLLSGDRHLADISCLPPQEGTGYPLYEATSSPMNWKPDFVPNEPNRFRAEASNFVDLNFGWLEIDWERSDPSVTVEIRDLHGFTALSARFTLGSLSPGVANCPEIQADGGDPTGRERRLAGPRTRLLHSAAGVPRVAPDSSVRMTKTPKTPLESAQSGVR